MLRIVLTFFGSCLCLMKSEKSDERSIRESVWRWSEMRNEGWQCGKEDMKGLDVEMVPIILRFNQFCFIIHIFCLNDPLV